VQGSFVWRDVGGRLTLDLNNPFGSTLARVQVDPDQAVVDPYGVGWIAELRTSDWEAAAAGLLTGEAAIAAYRALLEAQNISGE
jgi:hypothetical protein